MGIKRIFVLGAGTMGNGIAQTAAVSGFQVTMMDADPDQLMKAKGMIAKSVEKLLKKEKITPEAKEKALKITTTTDFSGLKKAELVIEAVTENLDLKQKIFAELDQGAPPKAILASNTSSISLTQLAAVTRRPDKVIGMHL